jgi:hypothetical protein
LTAKAILDELTNLYGNNDPLTELRSRNVTDPDILLVPPKGTLFTQRGDSWIKTSFMLERGVKKAKNAFGYRTAPR